MKLTNDVIIPFWRKDDQYGYFCQWYDEYNFILNNEIFEQLPKEIRDLDVYKDNFMNIRAMSGSFNTAEKFMMMCKALLFGDSNTYSQMEVSTDPKIQKALGRKVKNFNQDVWDHYCKDIVVIGNYLKFSQNSILKQFLLDTHDKKIIEASPIDTIWGIGLKFDDPNILDTDNWKGTNYLGECLMKVREIIRNN